MRNRRISACDTVGDQGDLRDGARELEALCSQVPEANLPYLADLGAPPRPIIRAWCAASSYLGQPSAPFPISFAIFFSCLIQGKPYVKLGLILHL
jgi:hypothetical protein